VGGLLYLRETLRMVERLELPAAQRQAILEGNLRRLCNGRLRPH
jgi:hypothetical protein